MNLEKETGISIMKIIEKLDAGTLCKTYKMNIEINDNAETLSEKLSMLAAEKILSDVDDIFEDKLKFVDQNHDEATYAPKIQKSEGKINWNKSAESIIGKINGLYPSPGAWFLFNSERYKVLKAEISNGVGKPGFIIHNSIEVSCNKNKSIKVLEIQREGRRPQKINEFKLGTQMKVGTDLNNV